MACASPSPTTTGGPLASGTVLFGLAVVTPDANAPLATASVPSPITSAKLSDRVGWIAYLSDRPQATIVTMSVLRVLESGPDVSVYSDLLTVGSADTVLIAQPPDGTLTAIAGTPGIYALRITRAGDNQVLAHGSITITP